MAGRTEREAVQNFLDPLQQALSCITDAVINISGGYYARQEPHALILGEGAPVPLAGTTRLALVVVQHYHVTRPEPPRGPWKVSTVGYEYALEDAEGHEIIAYHWHPGGPEVTFPHLHLRTGAGAVRQELVQAHIPTGRIALEDVLRFAITVFGVRPQRDDWSDVLDRTQAAYEAWRTWSGSVTRPTR